MPKAKLRHVAINCEDLEEPKQAYFIPDTMASLSFEDSMIATIDGDQERKHERA